MKKSRLLLASMAAVLLLGIFVAAPASAARTLEFGNQPADTQSGRTITSVPFDASSGETTGPFVTVVASANTRVTVAIDGGATLETVRADADGVATFKGQGLSISTPGVYRLKATAAGFDPGLSDPDGFRIFERVGTCSEGELTCDTGNAGSFGNNNMTARVQGTPASPGLVAATVGIQDLDCPDFDETTMTALPDTVSMFWENLQGDVIISLSISKTYDQAQKNNGANFYQICFTYDILLDDGSSKTFKPRGWETGDLEVVTGLLPDCSPTFGPPCVKSRTKDKKGNVLLVIRADQDARCG